MKKLAILGCTGSIGRQTLDVVRNNKEKFEVVGLSCGSDITSLIKLATEFGCDNVGIFDRSAFAELKSALPNKNICCGDDALGEEVIADADIAVVAVVGMIGLKAVLCALKMGKNVALANKEALVAGGSLVMNAVQSGKWLNPIDSEHSAVWQCLCGEKTFKRIILTASGGPFFLTPQSELAGITPERAIAHPNWKMGKKISVDCATMMNKGLEIIEARWLFNTFDIDYVIHPESIVHSMVEFDDGSIKAQAGFPDMRLPIQYALTYPDHIAKDYVPLKLPLSLKFLPPDEEKFPAPRLAKQAISSGGNAPIVLNAANEAAVRLFLEGKIAFTQIVELVADALACERQENVGDADDVFETHNRVYQKIYCKHRGC